MKTSQSTIFPGMELNKAVAFEDTQIQQIDSNRKAYQAGNAQTQSFLEPANKNQENNVSDWIAQVGMTFSDYMNSALYDPKFGFYSSGNVIFVKKKNKSAPSFLTYPVMMSPNFGRMVANQAYSMWRSMLYSKDILPNEQFSIIEFGAGEGILARDTLDAVHLYAVQEQEQQLNTHWQEFYKIIQYTIGEKSPDLRQRQKNLNQKYIKEHKLQVRAADARDVSDFTQEKHTGLIISNELPDAFPVHKIWQMEDGRIKVCVVSPVISSEWIDKNVSESKKKTLEIENSTHRALLSDLLQDPELATIYAQQNNERSASNGMIISTKEWLELKYSVCKNKEQSDAFDNDVYFLELYFDASYFPETIEYSKRHASFIRWLGTEIKNVKKPIWYMNYAAQGYIASVATILEKGFITTIDYGNNSIIHHNEMRDPIDALRMYPFHSGSSDRDVYSKPGRYDLTTSINFTDICLVGMEHGLNTLFYGPQHALNGVNIATAPEKTMIPFDLKNHNFAAPQSKGQLQKFDHSIEESFRMIIQQKNNTKSYYRLLHPSENLFPESE
jgi:SAM-dependent MidA family methyltransferase